MASFYGTPCGEPDESGPEPRPGDTGAPEIVGLVIFLSCTPCDERACGLPDCDHLTHDQREFATAAEAIALMHRGCGCVLVPKS